MYSTLSKFGKPLLVLENYKFRKFRLNQRGQQWICTKNTCSVTLLTDFSEEILLKKPISEHDHEHETNIARQYLLIRSREK